MNNEQLAEELIKLAEEVFQDTIDKTALKMYEEGILNSKLGDTVEKINEVVKYDVEKIQDELQSEGSSLTKQQVYDEYIELIKNAL